MVNKVIQLGQDSNGHQLSAALAFGHCDSCEQSGVVVELYVDGDLRSQACSECSYVLWERCMSAAD